MSRRSHRPTIQHDGAHPYFVGGDGREWCTLHRGRVSKRRYRTLLAAWLRSFHLFVRFGYTLHPYRCVIHIPGFDVKGSCGGWHLTSTCRGVLGPPA